MKLQLPNQRTCLVLGLGLILVAAGIATGLIVRAADDSELLAQPRSEVAALSPAEKDRLRGKHVRFVNKLNADEQEKLRRMDQELAGAPDAEELRGVMRRYHEWIKTISPTQRRDLLKAAEKPDERLQRVVEMLPLSKADSDRLEAWWDERVWERLPPQFKKQRPEPRKGGRSGQGFAGASMWDAYRRFNDKPLTREEYDKLSAQLSALPRAALDAQREDRERLHLVNNWRWRSRAPEVRGPGATEQELARYFSEELSPHEREELINLTLAERNRKLREHYFRKKFSGGKSPSGGSTSKLPATQLDGQRK
jgi:hypothetical protein